MDRDKGQKVKVHDDFVGEDFVTTEGISSGSGIAIGRGAKDVVAQKAVVISIEETAEILAPSFDDLIVQVDESDLPPDLKERMHSNLENLRSEVEAGKAGDVKNARAWLKEISGTMPDLNQPLWVWLEGTEQVSTPIKIVARKLLT